MSLKKELKARIEQEGQLTYNTMLDICRIRGYKPSNAERRLRELCNETNIEPIRTKGYISRWQAGKQKVLF
jgi:anaerobic ribonucleoside-triphosphate reductase